MSPDSPSHASLRDRIRVAKDLPPAPGGDYVLYWMIAARRTRSSFALDRAIYWAHLLDKPLLIFEPLRVAYPWASDRLHAFVLQGMRDNAASLAATPVFYYPYVEPQPGADKGLLVALADRACVVVTDEFPCFFLPRMVASAARRLSARLEVVDGVGLLPLAASDRAFATAAHFRRHVQHELPERLREAPRAHPLARLRLPELTRPPRDLLRRWPPAARSLLDGDRDALAKLPIDHEVPPARFVGGSRAALSTLRRFVAERLPHYEERRKDPTADVTSHLSPYLHFGHVSTHEVLAEVARAESWSRDQLTTPTGARRGYWHMSAPAESFLDQLVVWRELAYNTCARRPDDYDQLASLPPWAQETLAAHAKDPRPHLYARRTLEEGRTHDPLWNAAQRQLVEEGWFHNYMRLLWAKKIVEWSRTPSEALATMAELMNRWSLDGRDPNSYAGYLWTLGRYDRPWPERRVLGKVRAMTSESTARKVDVRPYIARYAPQLRARAAPQLRARVSGRPSSR